jgi:hypothetical protein
MAAEALLPPRRVLLLLALVLAGSAALAGALTTSLLLRGAPPVAAAPPAHRLAQVAGCGMALPDPDPTAALAAALGQPLARPPRAEAAAAPLAGLLATPAAQPAPPALPAAPAAAPIAAAAAVTAAAAAAPAAPAILAGYALDLGYFLVPDQAVAFATSVQERGVPVQLLALPDASGRVWTHVRTPPFAGSAQALAGAERIERALGVTASLVPPGTPTPAPPAGAPRP